MPLEPQEVPPPATATLLRGDLPVIARWVERWTVAVAGRQVLMIALGAGAFGVAMGWWRDPRQALYAGLKLPLIILLTAAGNALFNGMVAPLLGLSLNLRQSCAAVLTSFAIAGIILGAFSPLMAFMVWNLPALERGTAIAPVVHGAMLVTLVAVIAFAGVAANLRLLHVLRQLGGSPAAAWRTLFAWLAINLLLGSQVSWLLRPFIGTPSLEVQFVRADAWQGNFFEALLAAARRLFT